MVTTTSFSFVINRLVMKIFNDKESGNFDKTQLYFSFNDKYLGDKRSAYGGQLQFSVSYELPENITMAEVQPAANPGIDVILVGVQRLSATLPTAPTSTITQYSVSFCLHALKTAETNWVHVPFPARCWHENNSWLVIQPHSQASK